MDHDSLTRRAWYLDAAPATIAAWLIRIRWSRVFVDALVLAASLVLSPDEFPLRRLAPLVAASALVNADLAWRPIRTPRWFQGVSLVIDIAILTGLLELTGGPSNPFAVVYLVLIALGAVASGRQWATFLAVWAIVCYGLLIAWHLQELVPAHHRLIDFPTHLFTMWLALVALAHLVGHFVHEASTAVAAHEHELAAMRDREARAARLMSLTTLAAGAAHELSTPLGTIAIAARELERSLRDAPGVDAWAADAQLIREQVERCHAILDQMSGRAGGSTADLVEPTDIASLFADLRTRLPPEQAQRVQVHVAPNIKPVVVARAGLAQVLLSLIKNAFDASAPSRPVTLEGHQDPGSVRLIVRDEGHGMPPEVLSRAGEPFYTTKEAGSGFGLGLFLARMFAERCGGSLRLESGRGTTAVLVLPQAPESSS
jgi:two-component system sensor histidine kinase RegB